MWVIILKMMAWYFGFNYKDDQQSNWLTFLVLVVIKKVKCFDHFSLVEDLKVYILNVY
jgi:hypothetical protein